MQCAQKTANPDKESVNRSEVGKVRLLVGISVIMAEVGSASESSLLGHHNYKHNLVARVYRNASIPLLQFLELSTVVSGRTGSVVSYYWSSFGVGVAITG